MRDSDGGVGFFGNQKQRHRLANDHAAADDHGFGAVGFDAGDFEQLPKRQRRSALVVS